MRRGSVRPSVRPELAPRAAASRAPPPEATALQLTPSATLPSGVTPHGTGAFASLPVRPVLLMVPLLAACALLPWRAQWCCVLAAVILLGVPHGALDGEVARDVLRPRFGRAWFMVFALPYLALFALVLVGWQLAPRWALGGFLAASVWHFGAQDPDAGDPATGKAAAGAIRTGRRPALRLPGLPLPAVPVLGVPALGVLVLGGLPIAMPLLTHPAATLLVLGSVAQVPLGPVQGWLVQAALVWAALALVWVVRTAWLGGWRRLARLAALAALFWGLPPLVAFSIYFVAVHAPAHTDALIAMPGRAVRVRDRRGAILLALPVTGLTLLIGAGLWPLYAGPAPVRLLVVTLQVLSALTLPHMLLDAAMTWRERVQARGGRTDAP